MFLLAVLALTATLQGSAASPSATPAPSRKCEVRQPAWCITQGVFELTENLAQDGVHDHVWTLRGQFRRDSSLVVLEPAGCRAGAADAMEFVDFEKGIRWKDRTWDRLRARLRKDGSCDLTMLIPPPDDDSMEWAYSQGLMLVRPCPNEACSSPAVSDLKPEFAERRTKGASRAVGAEYAYTNFGVPDDLYTIIQPGQEGRSPAAARVVLDTRYGSGRWARSMRDPHSGQSLLACDETKFHCFRTLAMHFAVPRDGGLAIDQTWTSEGITFKVLRTEDVAVLGVNIPTFVIRASRQDGSKDYYYFTQTAGLVAMRLIRRSNKRDDISVFLLEGERGFPF